MEVGKNFNKRIRGDYNIKMTNNSLWKVGKNLRRIVKGNVNYDVDGSINEVVKKDLTFDVYGNTSHLCRGNITFDVDGNVNKLVKKYLTFDVDDNISHLSRGNITFDVDGNVNKLVKGNVTYDVDGDSSQMVKKNVIFDVKKILSVKCDDLLFSIRKKCNVIQSTIQSIVKLPKKKETNKNRWLPTGIVSKINIGNDEFLCYEIYVEFPNKNTKKGDTLKSDIVYLGKEKLQVLI